MLEEEKFNDKELELITKGIDNANRQILKTRIVTSAIITIIYIILLVLLVIKLVNDAKFHKKVATEFETCVTLEDDLYCKIEK